MPRKARHVIPNSDKGGWDSKRENAKRYPNILIQKGSNGLEPQKSETGKI